MDESCTDTLTEDVSDDDVRSDDSSCDDASAVADDDGCTDDGEDAPCASDGCEEEPPDDECAEVRAADDDECAEPDDDGGDTLGAVPDEPDTATPLPDSGAVEPLVPVDVSLPPRTVDFATIPGIGGDTAAVLGSVSGQLADAGRIAHAPLTGAGAAGISGELARADTAGRAAAALSPLVTGEEMRNDAMADELHRQQVFATREAESEALLTLREGESLLSDPRRP